MTVGRKPGDCQGFYLAGISERKGVQRGIQTGFVFISEGILGRTAVS
jgi:hypothetical protein